MTTIGFYTMVGNVANLQKFSELIKGLNKDNLHDNRYDLAESFKGRDIKHLVIECLLMEGKDGSVTYHVGACYRGATEDEEVLTPKQMMLLLKSITK